MTSSMGRRIAALTVAGICLVAAAGPAAAELLVPREAHEVTVVLADGWRLEQVDVRWEPRAKVLDVRRGEMTRRLQPPDMRAVLAADGRDITREVLPANVLGLLAGATVAGAAMGAQPLAVAPPETVTVEVERPDRRRFILGITPVVGYGGFAGDQWWGDFSADARLGLRLRVGGSAAFYGVGEYMRQDVAPPDALVVEVGSGHIAPSRLEILTLGLGLRPPVGDRWRAWPFLELTGGFARPTGGAYPTDAPFAQETRPALQARLGLSLPVFPHFEIELSGAALITGREFPDGDTDGWGSVWAAEIGVSLMLGP